LGSFRVEFLVSGFVVVRKEIRKDQFTRETSLFGGKRKEPVLPR